MISEEEKEAREVADKIHHILTYFPKITHSMLQVGLGSTVPASQWRPVLEEMVLEGEVRIESVMTTLPSGRAANYSIIQLGQDLEA